VEGEASHSLPVYTLHLYEAYTDVTIFDVTVVPSSAIKELTEVRSRRHTDVLLVPEVG